MTSYEGLARTFHPNWEGLVDNIQRKGTPERVYHIELFHDAEIRHAIVERFNLNRRLNPNDPHYEQRLQIEFHRFCGFDYVRAGLTNMNMPTHKITTEDTAALKRLKGRAFQDEHTGPIMSREDFEQYPFPDCAAPGSTRDLEWYQENLPDDMCIIGGLAAHFAEYLTWLMGYETLCFALYEHRDLVKAISEKLMEDNRICVKRILEFDRVKMIWGSDDMGFKTSLLFSPDDMREFVLPGHKMCAEMAHRAGRPYLLHSCGNLTEIMDDLIDDVKIDAKHSFEDTIEDVREVKHTYGKKIALLGGIDVNFLCLSDPPTIRKRVRDTLDQCLPGGGYCLGTGNSVANYIPLDNYLTMLDEGRLYTP
jgi:uroporphyrinogen decarboxylase